MSGLLSKLCAGSEDFTVVITEAVYQLNINSYIFTFCLIAVDKRVLKKTLNVQKSELWLYLCTHKTCLKAFSITVR